ncbi:hypothetical protein PAQ31011_04494 [Pandoraea aquatica]|uniref:Uncharacterized protein n=1 Tax=Pandoraea aquatica TaxID=2508290 RepID=A0A5E4YFN4_9BURK|nr:hypothetical protein [Pandoraea aquatica]VVE47218.1 hypothetical protein PAQ31011_04494 [Pandoraea aquatica]
MLTPTIEDRMAALVASMAATEAVLQTLAHTDRATLGLAQAALRATQPPSAATPASSAALGELAGEMDFLTYVSMDDLLDEWRRLYSESTTATPQAAADAEANADSPPRLAEHQAIFRTMVAHLKTLATVRNREADTFRSAFASLAQLIGQNAPVEKTLIARMRAVGTQLLSNETWLSAGTDAGAQARSVTYQSLQREGMTSNAQAEQLVELIQLDLMRLKWVSEFEPALKAQTEALASASAALGGS